MHIFLLCIYLFLFDFIKYINFLYPIFVFKKWKKTRYLLILNMCVYDCHKLCKLFCSLEMPYYVYGYVYIGIEFLVCIVISKNLLNLSIFFLSMLLSFWQKFNADFLFNPFMSERRNSRIHQGSRARPDLDLV